MGILLSGFLSVTTTVLSSIKKIVNTILHFISVLPPIIAFIIYAGFFLAILSIGIAHIKAIAKNCRKWKKDPNSQMMFGYFTGTADYQRVLISDDLFEYVKDERAILISAAGCSYYLGRYKSDSKLKLFFLSFIYIPLAIVSFPELLMRGVFGYAYVIIINFIHWIGLKIFYVISSLLIRFFSLIDKFMRTDQHCPHCYRTFSIPKYICPYCGRTHKKLVPGKTGVLFARCECGKFLPSTIFTGRTKLESICPECNKPLAASEAEELSIQLIGGNSSGKTAYFASFQHIYRSIHEKEDDYSISVFPNERFDELEKMYSNGNTVASSKTSTESFSIVHSYNDGTQYNLVIYDIPDEVLISGVYEQNPLNFAYSNGIILILDPTAMRSVRIESEKKGQKILEGSYADNENEAEDIIVEFIQQFSRLNNRSSNKMIKTPIAVIINKTDLKVINSRIGNDIVMYKFKANTEKYNGIYSYARNTICREYLISIGMSNVINNLESVFQNVQYFAASAMGHANIKDGAFAPIGVIEPMAWIAEKNKSQLSAFLQNAMSFINGDTQNNENISRKLEKRYIYAEKLLASNEFEKAEEEFKLLGNYRDSEVRAESVVDVRYKYAKMLFSDGEFEEAWTHFEKIKGYRDAGNYALESLYRMSDLALARGDYELAVRIFESLGTYRGSDKKQIEAKYLFAKKKEEEGDAKGALAYYTEIGDYKDARHRTKQLLPYLIKEGMRRNLQFGNYKWRVLKVDKGFALMVTETIINKKAFNDDLKDVVWKNCTVRRYLNKDFISDFEEEEKKKIFTLLIKNEDNKEYGTDSGEDTLDAVFLLSSAEMKSLFDSDEDRLTTVNNETIGWYWLRTSGGNNKYASIVDKHGVINEGGNSVNSPDGGIRPALWISLE